MHWMENKYVKIPTIEDLKKQIELDNINENDNYNWVEILMKEVINIITKIPNFRAYLIDRDYDKEYYLSYEIYWQIIEYLNYCYINNNLNPIKDILEYLNELSKSKNDDILNLLIVWVLEVFDIHKEILPDIIKLMPDNLKKLFLKHFSNYLD